MTNYGELLKRWEYQTILSVSWETCTRVKKQQLEPCMGELIGSGLRKEYNKALCCHPVYLTYMLKTSWQMSGWMSYKQKSREAEETSTTTDMQMITILWQKAKNERTSFLILNLFLIEE